MLNKLEENIVEKGDYYIITKDKNSFQILIYFHNRKLINDFDKSYNDFSEIISKFKINNYEKGKYILTKYYLNKESGSAFEKWKDFAGRSVRYFLELLIPILLGLYLLPQ